ncbi:MAG: thioredoxin domain-containing protein, partial [Acetobacteraceae bacterium]
MAESANLLRYSTSPYLLQHADNPVHWRPWGPAALEEAQATNKPILLSIGYAACHWCHVMAHESFENAETAALMNALFVSIKVDREERPDIDHLYMSALHALGEQGGWPLTMFLTPDGAPFWGGTYFPPEPRWGRPSFRQVLQGVSAAWQAQDQIVTQNSAALRQALERLSAVQEGDMPGPRQLDAAAQGLLRLTDPDNGGLRGAPKFPNPAIHRFLWQDAFRTGHPEGRDALHRLLHHMSQGGIYDHLGGGYARYSTDAVWLVPHFEKMLYDNGQILELLALAFADRADPLYLARAEETVGWMLRDMAAGEAFAASEDADSEGEEGKFYVWTEAEIDILLGDKAPPFKAAYDVTPTGNWEGHTILRRVTPPGSAEQEAALAQAQQILLAARAKRVRPGRDDKVLADWNGLAIAGLVRAGSVFQQPDWIAHAGAALDFILHHLGAADGRVNHAWRLGRVTAAGLLDDQASLARAALALHEATGDPVRLTQAMRLADAAMTHFRDGAGGFFTTADDATDVPLARPRTAADDATP